MGSESQRIRSRRLNGIKKVCCREFFKISTHSALLSPAAEAGLPRAQYNLGVIFDNGLGVSANPVKAVEWYQKGMLSRILQNINTLSASFASRRSWITTGSI